MPLYTLQYGKTFLQSMGNEQSSGGRGLADSSSVLKDCVIDADPIINDEHWSLHHAQLHSTPMSVFISKDNDGSLENLAKVRVQS